MARAWSGREFIGESTLGGVAVYAIYQALLTALRTEALRNRGAIDRQTQVQAIASSVWESAKHGAVGSLVLSVILLVVPWFGLPLA